MDLRAAAKAHTTYADNLRRLPTQTTYADYLRRLPTQTTYTDYLRRLHTQSHTRSTQEMVLLKDKVAELAGGMGNAQAYHRPWDSPPPSTYHLLLTTYYLLLTTYYLLLITYYLLFFVN